VAMQINNFVSQITAKKIFFCAFKWESLFSWIIRFMESSPNFLIKKNWIENKNSRLKNFWDFTRLTQRAFA
jgi:hypothetical protein